MWGEEADLSCRTFLKGYKMINVPAKVYHLYGRQNRKSVDSTPEFEEMNRFGIERAKIKVGLSVPNDKYMVEWDKYGCDGTLYKNKINELFCETEREKQESKNKKILELGYNVKSVLVCPHCGTKTFFNQGSCRWCYKDLLEAK